MGQLDRALSSLSLTSRGARRGTSVSPLRADDGGPRRCRGARHASTPSAQRGQRRRLHGPGPIRGPPWSVRSTFLQMDTRRHAIGAVEPRARNVANRRRCRSRRDLFSAMDRFRSLGHTRSSVKTTVQVLREPRRRMQAKAQPQREDSDAPVAITFFPTAGLPIVLSPGPALPAENSRM